MALVSQVQTDNGISWHVEQRGSGPHIILIPSGEGDCGSFDRLSPLICSSFTVTTFDMPGFSRSTCPPSALANLTPAVIASQIVSLMDALSIAKATVYGSSSGGLFSIALLQHHPSRIDRIIIHEVPMKRLSTLDPVIALPDEKIPEHCKGIFANFFNEDQAKWEALGEEYHTRLEQNYITWLRSYPPMLDSADWGKEGMGKLREGIWWSVGALIPMGSFFDNVVFCAELGIPIRKLNSKHFPHVSIAEDLAEYIVGCRR